MTRKVDDAIEYQILYLPKSSSANDFTVFEWLEDVTQVWERFLNTLESQHADVSIFKKGPFVTFGILNKTIQSRMSSEANDVNISGVLKCDSSSGKPSVANYKTYLGVLTSDSNNDWIPNAFSNEEIPYYYSQHVSEDSVYWVDGRTGVSTWTHPLYQKYHDMLARARIEKPLSDFKSLTHFQLCFLMDCGGHFETIDNIMEVARIFGIKLTQEPFLFHLMKLCLNFYAITSKKDRNSIRCVDDILIQMDRRRREVNSLREEVETIKKSTNDMSICVECSLSQASIKCSDCNDIFCAECFGRIHSSGSRRFSHKKLVVEISRCSECQSSFALFQCVHCFDIYCVGCLSRYHMRGGRRNHIHIILRNPHRKGLVDFKSSVLLEQAMSPWVKIDDPQGLPTYTNLITNESRRDIPLTVINE
jgi:hypothetical protein